MAFTIDPTTPIGKIRLLITDRDPADAIFEDAAISAFLALEADSVKAAAALALETIATDEALTLKVVKLLQLSTDGAKLSDAILKRAAMLRAQAAASAPEDDAATFEIAEWIVDGFSRDQVIANSLRRRL